MSLRLIYIGLLLLVCHTHARELTQYLPPQPIAGSHYLNDSEVATYLENLPRENPQAYQKLMLLENERRSFNKGNQLQQQFWAVNVVPGEPVEDEDFYTTIATLRREGSGIRVWVEDDSWNQQYVRQTEVDAIYNALVFSTPNGSINPNQGIVQIERGIYGQPPNRAGDGIINFLVLDIQDGYDPNMGVNSFVAGYFFSRDQTNLNFSNNMDLLYLDAFPGIQQSNGNRNPESVLSTTAHELQHLIHFNYDPEEEVWVNEGLSELASKICGYSLGTPGRFLQDPNVDLTRWENELADYSRVGLWTFYLFEQLGEDIIRNLTQGSSVGQAAVNTALQQNGINDRDFESLFRDWVIANYVNDTAFNSAYGYRDSELSQIRASSDLISSFPSETNVVLNPYSASYLRFQGGDTLELDFLTLLPDSYLLRREGNQIELLEISSDPFVLNDFNSTEEFVLIQANLSGTSELNFCAWSPQSVLSQTLLFDDQEIDVAIGGAGAAANLFQIPFSNGEVTQIRFFSVAENVSQQLRITSSASGRPGNDLIAPLTIDPVGGGSWVELDLPTPVSGLNAGSEFFVVLESSAFAYDEDSNPGGRSYFNNSGSGWRQLSDFSIGGNTLTGSWMIQARIEGGLALSAGRDCGAVSPLEIALLSPAPNPAIGIFPTIITSVLEAGEMRYTVFNALGQQIGSLNQVFGGAGKSFRISLAELSNQTVAELASGIYFVQGQFTSASGVKRETNTLRFIYLR